MLEIEHYKENEDEFTEPAHRAVHADERPGGLVRALLGSRPRTTSRSFRLDRISAATVIDETLRAAARASSPTSTAGRARARCAASRTARVWIAPERARWAREDRRVVQELEDGAVIVELPYAGNEWLAREILKEAGDAAVLEPEDARTAVLEAAESLQGIVSR